MTTKKGRQETDLIHRVRRHKTETVQVWEVTIYVPIYRHRRIIDGRTFYVQRLNVPREKVAVLFQRFLREIQKTGCVIRSRLE